jgi:hypothetical protein
MIVLHAHIEDDPGCLLFLVIVAGFILAVLLEILKHIPPK